MNPTIKCETCGVTFNRYNCSMACPHPFRKDLMPPQDITNQQLCSVCSTWYNTETQASGCPHTVVAQDYRNMNQALRPHREAIYMRFALDWSRRSTCKRLGVGAVITSSDLRQVLAIGYNGRARGLPHESCRNTPGDCGCLHAEDNAIVQCDGREPNKILFVTHMPCEMCAQRIVNANITRVFFLNAYRVKVGVELLKSCQVKVYQMDPALVIESPCLGEVPSPSTAKPTA